MTRKIEHLALSSLAVNPVNPKAHDLDTIDKSIGRFGYVEPVVVDGRTGQIISGHGRTATLRAMEERGETAPEGVVLDEDGSWLVPVVTGWSSRTDAEASAALIAMNRTTELGGWVDDALLDLLDGLAQDEEAGLSGVGYSEDELEELRAWVGHFEKEQEEPEDRDLDTLEEEFGGMTEEDGLIRVVLNLEPELAERLTAIIEKAPSLPALVSRWIEAEGIE